MNSFPPFDDDDDRDLVEALAEEFVARRRRGETVTVAEYAERHPDRAEDILELFPTIAAMERHKPRPESSWTIQAMPGLGPGEMVGEYRLVREIGRGGMGVVFEAEQESLGRRVAVKVLPRGGGDDRAAKRFRREARTAGKLHHAHIIPVHAVGEHQGMLYFVMQLIPGVGLDRVIRELRRDGNDDGAVDQWPWQSTAPEDPRSVVRALHAGVFARSASSGSGTALTAKAAGPDLSGVGSADAATLDPTNLGGFGPHYWRSVARVGWQAADALEFAHAHGVLHRDVKPSNLLLDAAGAVWIADFGLAKAADHDDLSRAGDLVGTLRYMAPERFRGVCDAQGDVYGLGLTLYEALTLRPAFKPTDNVELVRRITSTVPRLPRLVAPAIPRDLETIVLKAIAPDPRARYESAGALAADLVRYLDGLPVLARRTSAPERLARWAGRNRLAATLAATTLVLTLVSALFIGLFLAAPPHHRPDDDPLHLGPPEFLDHPDDERPPPRPWFGRRPPPPPNSPRPYQPPPPPPPPRRGPFRPPF
jgi:eukaryotic-like serine/threonine-protein kinase